jgi:hypothetical protein
MTRGSSAHTPTGKLRLPCYDAYSLMTHILKYQVLSTNRWWSKLDASLSRYNKPFEHHLPIFDIYTEHPDRSTPCSYFFKTLKIHHPYTQIYITYLYLPRYWRILIAKYLRQRRTWLRIWPQHEPLIILASMLKPSRSSRPLPPNLV